MPRQLAWMLASLCLLFATASASATNLIIYDNQSENGFDDGCSFPSPSADFDFANTTVVHSAPRSVRFTPDNNNAVSWCAPATYSAATDYTGIDFWVNGGTTGSQNVNLVLGLAGNPVQQASLMALNGGNAIAVGAWTHIQASFTSGVLAYNGQFDQISLQDESGGVQANMYFDDVSLVAAAAASGQNYLFGDSFEPEYMFVPQYTSGSIKVYQRAANTANFSFVRTAILAAGIKPNSLAFAPDGNLWVVDDANSQLLRYSLQSILTGTNPLAADRTHSAAGNGGLYDLAFFGTYAYVASDSGILKFAISDLNAGIANAPTQFSASLNVPAGLSFDTQGRLWICNNGNSTAVRMDNLSTGHIDKILSDAAVGGRQAMVSSEGVGFDEFGSLWVGNNNEPTISAYNDAQINDGVLSTNPTPVYQIDIAPGLGSGDIGAVHPTGYVGGIAFDRHGDVRANYEYDYTVQAYTLSAAPSGGGYAAYAGTALPVLTNATTDPGRGGIAFWPVPSTLHTH
jgi:hypothetical protein